MNRLQRLTLGLSLAAATAVPIVALASTAHAGTAPTPTPPTTDCSTVVDDARPAAVEGQPPTFATFAPGGVYLWHDTTGWHLRVTHETSTPRTFRGTIHVPSGQIRFDKVLDEGNDAAHLSLNGRTVIFSLKNYGKVDGIDFRTACAPQLAFAFTVNGHRLPASRIFIGSAGTHPAHDPFKIPRS